jgi:hypothetical protein
MIKKFNPKTASGEMAFIARQLQQTRYCKLCGKQMLQCSTNEDGSINYNLQWELENGVHYGCFAKFARENENAGT